jgi:hypothetical protein
MEYRSIIEQVKPYQRELNYRMSLMCLSPPGSFIKETRLDRIKNTLGEIKRRFKRLFLALIVDSYTEI